MLQDKIKAAIEAHIPGAQVTVEGEGCNATVTVVSEAFTGKSLLQKQRMVYAAVNDMIASGELHALTIRAHTPEEWQARRA